MISHFLKKSCILSLFFLLSGFCVGNVAQGQADEQLKEQMRNKLRYTKVLMAGLALDDANRINQGTMGLLRICDALGWTGPARAEFEMRDKAFHTAVQRLSNFVDARNYDGARLQFIDMLVLCMDCHGLGKE